MTVLIGVQQMDNLGAASSKLQRPLQLQSHLTAASNDMDYKESAMSPNPFLEAARQSSQTEHTAQIHQPAGSNQCQGEGASLPMSSSAVDNLIGSSTQPHHQLQLQHVGDKAPLQRLEICQLQELLGMNTLGKHLNQSRRDQLHDGQCATTIATSSTRSSTSRLLPQKRSHASVSPLLQSSGPAAAFAGVSTTPASGQLPMHHSLADSQTALWPQPEALGAFRSQRASLTSMLSTHLMSACGPSQDCGRSLQQQTAFLRPFQTALHGPTDTAARQTSGQNPRANPFTQTSEPAIGCPLSLSLSCGLGWQGRSLASTEVDSGSKLSSSTSSKGLLMGVCQSQVASTSFHQDALDTSVRPHEQLSQRKSPCMSGPLRPNRWRNLPSQAAAPPSSNASSDTLPGSSRLCLQGQGLQCQHSFVNPMTNSNVGGEAQWFKGPEAMRKAALMLNAQLAHIDKQVLEHVVPRCGQQGKGGPGLSDASVIQTQVLLTS